MAGRRVYGGSSMAALLQSEGILPETIEALLASSSSSNGFHGTGSMVNFEEICRSTRQRPFYGTLDLEETGDEDFDECLNQPEKKRRLTANQVQFLEKSFEIENKLEPERKIQLARDLGLQPRQVAIWFQNRRARWKTKQLEKDYEVLNSSYNALKADYEDLLKEKEKLKAEVASLTNQLLLKEGKKDNSEMHELNRSPHALQNPSSESESDAMRTETTVTTFKQEDLSSANSAVLDSDSPPHAIALPLQPTDSPNAFEPDQSDLSYAEDNVELRECRFLKLEVDNMGNCNFPVEDQIFWFWHY